MSDIFSNSELVSWFTNLNNALTILQLSYNDPSLSASYNIKSATLLNMYVNNISDSRGDKFFDSANVPSVSLVTNNYPATTPTRTQVTAANNIIKKIVCRNEAAFTNQTHENGTNSQGYLSNVANNNGTCSQGTNSVACQHGSNSARNSYGTQSVSCSYGSESNGYKSNGTESNGSQGNGTRSNGMNGASSDSNGVEGDGGNNWGGRSDSCGTAYPNPAGTHSNCNDSVCSNGTRSNGTERNGTERNGRESNGSESNRCSRGTNSVGCDETCSNTCSRTCSQGTNSHGNKNNGYNGYGVQGNQYKTNGSCVDVFNVNTNNG